MTVPWIAVAVVAVLLTSTLVGLLVGGAIKIRNRQVPHDEDDHR